MTPPPDVPDADEEQRETAERMLDEYPAIGAAAGILAARDRVRDSRLLGELSQAIEQRAKEYRENAQHLREKGARTELRYYFDQAAQRAAHADGLEWAIAAIDRARGK